MKRFFNKFLTFVIAIVLFTGLPLTKAMAANDIRHATTFYITQYYQYENGQFNNVTELVRTSEDFRKLYKLYDKNIVRDKDTDDTTKNPDSDEEIKLSKELESLLKKLGSKVEEADPTFDTIEEFTKFLQSSEIYHQVSTGEFNDFKDIIELLDVLQEFNQTLYEMADELGDQDEYDYPSTDLTLGNQNSYVCVPGTNGTIKTAESERTTGLQNTDFVPQVSTTYPVAGVNTNQNLFSYNQPVYTTTPDSYTVTDFIDAINDTPLMQMNSTFNDTVNYINILDWLEDTSKTDLLIDTEELLGSELNAFNDQLGIFGDVLTIISDGYDIATDNMYATNPIAHSIEAGVLGVDMTLAAVDIALILGGVTCPPLLVATVAVSLATSFIHSEAGGAFFDTLWNTLFFRTKGPNGVNCYKPNIYIYTKDGTVVIIYFDDVSSLLTTIPYYTGSWYVTASPDGTLTDSSGNEYGYLFYEADVQTHIFQTEEGWLINADTRTAQYEEILREYGFNETEIKDFVEYWEDKLEAGKDYVMYPQLDDTVNRAMPMSINPTPTTLARIWFAFEEADSQSFKTPQIEKINRTDFTVIEWGGLILDEE